MSLVRALKNVFRTSVRALEIASIKKLINDMTLIKSVATLKQRITNTSISKTVKHIAIPMLGEL